MLDHTVGFGDGDGHKPSPGHIRRPNENWKLFIRLSQADNDYYGIPADVIWNAKLKEKEVNGNQGVPLPAPTDKQVEQKVEPAAKVNYIPATEVSKQFGDKGNRFRTSEEQRLAEAL